MTKKKGKSSSNSQKPKKLSNRESWEQRLMLLSHIPDEMMKMEGKSRKELEEEKQSLERAIEYSKMGKSNRIKGSSYENDIAKKFLSKWDVKLIRTPASGGFQKSSDNELIRGDLSALDPSIRFLLHLECKNWDKWKVKDWWEQTIEDCPDDNIPVTVFHQRQKNAEGKRVQEADDFVMLRLEDFLDIVDKEEVIKQVKGRNNNDSKTKRNRARRKVKPKNTSGNNRRS